MTPRTEHLRENFEMAHRVFLGTVDDLTDDAAAATFPAATVGPILPIYAHAVCSEDVIFAAAAGREPVCLSPEWAARTGIPGATVVQTPEWAGNTFNLGGLRAYADAVFAAAVAWLETADDAALDREIDGLRPGSRTTPVNLLRVGLIHISGHGGEIAALKGVLGLKGLPF
jgi:hypothetical protein